jgi:amidohydrolase
MGTGKWEQIAERLGEIVKGAELTWGVKTEYHYGLGSPAVNNDAALTALAADTAREIGLTVGPVIPGMGGEDFALYQERIRGVFLNIGVGSPQGIHHPGFIADPEVLVPAAELLSRLAEKALSRLGQ